MRYLLLITMGFSFELVAICVVRVSEQEPVSELKLDRLQSSPALSVTWLGFSPDDKYLSTRYGDGDGHDVIEVWTGPKWKAHIKKRAPVAEGTTTSTMGTCSYFPDSSGLYYINNDDICSFTLSDRSGEETIFARGVGLRTMPVQTLLSAKEKGGVYASLFAADGDQVFLEYWRAGKREKPPSTSHIAHEFGRAISPCHTPTTLIFAAYASSNTDKYLVIKCNLTANVIKPEIIFEMRTAITALALSPDGKYAAIGDLRGGVGIYSMNDKKQAFRKELFSASIHHLQFSNDSSLIAVASSDRAKRDNLCVVQVPSGVQVMSVSASAKGVLRCCLNSAASEVAVVCGDSTLRTWTLPRRPMPK